MLFVQYWHPKLFRQKLRTPPFPFCWHHLNEQFTRSVTQTPGKKPGLNLSYWWCHNWYKSLEK